MHRFDSSASPQSAAAATATATHILEQFKRLTPAEKREVFQAIVQETAAVPTRAAVRLERHGANRIRLDPVLANEIALSDAFNPEES
jgi:hypothetical protein